MTSKKNKPVEFKMGPVKALVWLNETSSGIRHNVTFVRLYRKDDQWQETTSFGRDDLPLLEKVANRAHDFIFQQNGNKPDNEG